MIQTSCHWGNAVNATSKRIRWSFVFLAALALGMVIAAAIWGPVLSHQRVKAKDANTEPSTLQDYVEQGHSAFLDEKSKQRALRLLPYESISFERTYCFGDCPAYVFTLYKDGRATLVTDNLKGKGKKYYTAEIWLGDYIRMTQMVELARAASHEPGYMGQWTDDYTAIIRASSRSGSWTVSDYGRVAPVEVWALEMLLGNLKEQIEWTPSREF